MFVIKRHAAKGSTSGGRNFVGSRNGVPVFRYLNESLPNSLRDFDQYVYSSEGLAWKDADRVNRQLIDAGFLPKTAKAEDTLYVASF